MMRRSKKLIGWILCAALAVGMLPGTVKGAKAAGKSDGVVIDAVSFTSDSDAGSLAVSKTDSMSAAGEGGSMILGVILLFIALANFSCLLNLAKKNFKKNRKREFGAVGRQE